MRLGTFLHKGREKVVAVIDDETVLDVATAGVHAPDMVALIEGGETALAAIRIALEAPGDAAIPLADTVHRCPIKPVQYRDCLVFEEHLKNSFAAAQAMTGREFAIPRVW